MSANSITIANTPVWSSTFVTTIASCSTPSESSALFGTDTVVVNSFSVPGVNVLAIDGSKLVKTAGSSVKHSPIRHTLPCNSHCTFVVQNFGFTDEQMPWLVHTL